MKALVIFYSRTGHTKKLGQMIFDVTKGEMEEIIDTKKRTGIFGYFSAGRDAMKKRITKIEPVKNNPADFDMVFIGTPIHSWGLSAPIRTYLRENKGKFKVAGFFCTCEKNGFEKAFKDMEDESGIKPTSTLVIKEDELDKKEMPVRIGQFVAACTQQIPLVMKK